MNAIFCKSHNIIASSFVCVNSSLIWSWTLTDTHMRLQLCVKRCITLPSNKHDMSFSYTNKKPLTSETDDNRSLVVVCSPQNCFVSPQMPEAMRNINGLILNLACYITAVSTSGVTFFSLPSSSSLTQNTQHLMALLKWEKCINTQAQPHINILRQCQSGHC
jgi:hypothetical protein